MALVDPGDPADLTASARAAFADRYGEPPTSVGRAPGRVNLIGEHTDYNAGLVLPVALPHATYAAARARGDELVRITSRQQDEAWEGTLGELGPRSVEGWAGYAAGVVWALREAGYDRARRGPARRQPRPRRRRAVLVRRARVLGRRRAARPARRRAHGRRAPDRLVDAAIRAETEVVGAPTGGMDQTVAVLGEEGAALLIDFATHESTAVPLDLAGHTLLVTDTRVSHALTDGGYGVPAGRLRGGGPRPRRTTLREATLDAVEALADDRVRRRARTSSPRSSGSPTRWRRSTRDDWAEVGRLFDASHRSMRDDFEISCPELDCAVAVAVQAGAVAARMTGGGFGGSSVAVVPDERVEAVMRAVDAAFVLEGFRSPVHLRAVPVRRRGRRARLSRRTQPGLGYAARCGRPRPAARVLGMTNYPNSSRNTAAFFAQAGISFAIALLAMLFAVLYLPVDPWVRAFLGLGTLYLTTSSFTLAKCIRDAQESQSVVTRLDQARVDKILAEHDPFRTVSYTWTEPGPLAFRG